MTSAHWNVLLIYAGFSAAATLLALMRRWLEPGGRGESVWRKYPAYIFINLVFIAACWSPPEFHLLTFLLALLGALAAWELARVLVQSPRMFLLPVAAFLLILIAGILDMTSWLKIWLAVFLSAGAVATWVGKPDDYPRHAFALTGCVVYIPLCLAAYLSVQQSDPSGFRAVFLYLVIATNDALAQITGELFGRRKLTPQISPAKTVAGALGGVLFASGMGIALSQSTGLTYLTGGFFGLVLGLAGLTGDLTASIWKRVLGIKNYSGLLGAQGGVLDRFDGLIFAAPVFYLLLVIVP
ncbi:MAG: phosphatidate cytidylyltransferase [Anaerolineales bacterium]|nr:MAG: phosphatidate cytidylyltransferase [Anaerolineales bacterium]